MKSSFEGPHLYELRKQHIDYLDAYILDNRYGWVGAEWLVQSLPETEQKQEPCPTMPAHTNPFEQYLNNDEVACIITTFFGFRPL